MNKNEISCLQFTFLIAGAVLVENCAVRRLDVQGGRVAGVYTEQGRIGCEQVVVAGGAWSSLFLAVL